MTDEGAARVHHRAWTRVLAATLITIQGTAAAFFAFFVIAAAGCDLSFGGGSCGMGGIKILASLALIAISGGMLAWWIYAFARFQRAGLIAATLFQCLVIVYGVVAMPSYDWLHGGFLPVGALIPGVVTLAIMIMDGSLRRRILTSGTT